VYDWIICSDATDIKLLFGSERTLYSGPIIVQETECSM